MPQINLPNFEAKEALERITENNKSPLLNGNFSPNTKKSPHRYDNNLLLINLLLISRFYTEMIKQECVSAV